MNNAVINYKLDMVKYRNSIRENDQRLTVFYMHERLIIQSINQVRINNFIHRIIKKWDKQMTRSRQVIYIYIVGELITEVR